MTKTVRQFQPLVSVSVVRPFRRGRPLVSRYGSLASALESFRPWVCYGQAMRIFEKAAGL